MLKSCAVTTPLVCAFFAYVKSRLSHDTSQIIFSIAKWKLLNMGGFNHWFEGQLLSQHWLRHLFLKNRLSISNVKILIASVPDLCILFNFNPSLAAIYLPTRVPTAGFFWVCVFFSSASLKCHITSVLHLLPPQTQ